MASFKDYFNTLKLKRNADDYEVNTAFKKYALKYHPQKNPAQMHMYLPKFHAICEAFEVLSDQRLRTVYEEYGEAGLRRGTSGPDGVFRGGYQYQQNCYEIFDKFFLENNPFFDLCTDLTDVRGTGLEIEGSYFGTAFKGMNQPAAEKLQDITVTVDVTLQEIYIGSRKKVSYTRRVLGLDGRAVKEETNRIDVFVRRGMSESHTILMEGFGHQQENCPSTNLIVKFRLVPSAATSNASLFSRHGNLDLIYKHTVSLTDVIQCKPVSLVTLDGRHLTIPVDQIVSPGNVRKVQGEGIRCQDDEEHSERCGDLYIQFDVQFPSKLPDDLAQRQRLLDALTPQQSN